MKHIHYALHTLNVCHTSLGEPYRQNHSSDFIDYRKLNKFLTLSEKIPGTLDDRSTKVA